MILHSKIHSLILREVKESKNYKSIINDKRFKLFFNSIFVRRILEICGTHNCFLFDNKILKEFYNAVFYSTEVKSIFMINENSTDDGLKRTAKTYFEFLYYHNPKLYSTLFIPKSFNFSNFSIA